ncbi:MAG TPA: hypothetical protein VL961_11345 [Acidimicrobiales bacterium]|nr:hypothetical protein [Acidimicrobiales bacterium]
MERRHDEFSDSRRRLLRGYAPLVVFAAGFALITLLVPSIGREQNVTTVRESLAGQKSTSGRPTSTPTTAPAGTPTTGGSVTGTTAATAPSGAPSPSTAERSVSSSSAAVPKSGTGAAVTGNTSACPGQALQVPGDPYSPPCVAFSGSNGGATSNGVTAGTITLSYRFTSDYSSESQSVDSLGGAAFTPTKASTESTVNGLVAYFNSHFQFYGRKLAVDYFNGQGSMTNEEQDIGQAQTMADATNVAQQIHAFADINTQDELYANDLVQQHVVNFGGGDLANSTLEASAPYTWGTSVSCNTLITAVMEVVDKELANRPAAYAGGSLKGQPRKIALLAPSSPDYASCANEAIALAKAAGVTISDDISYELDASTLTQQDDTIVAKLANDGDTTVLLFTDPISNLLLTERAAQQDYTPEWFEMGIAADVDAVAQLYDQSEWSHTFGISFLGEAVPVQDMLGYDAYKASNSDEPATSVVQSAYETLDELAIGIQLAGPDLTPTTFEEGMRAYPGSQPGSDNLQFGSWLFPAGDFNPTQDSWLISWNPNKVSPQNGQPGSYDIDTPRYKAGQYPTGPPALPSGFPYTPSANSS